MYHGLKKVKKGMEILWQGYYSDETGVKWVRLCLLGFLLEKRLPLGHSLSLGFGLGSIFSGGTEPEVLAEIAPLPVRNILSLGFSASVVGILVVKLTVPAAVDVSTAMGTLVLPGDLSL